MLSDERCGYSHGGKADVRGAIESGVRMVLLMAEVQLSSSQGSLRMSLRAHDPSSAELTNTSPMAVMAHQAQVPEGAAHWNQTHSLTT
jgi:hypothetical protein